MFELIAIVIGLSMGSWFCHTMYYKQMGHPWADINGPEFGSNKFGFSIYHCGTERYFSCICGRKNLTSRNTITDHTREV